MTHEQQALINEWQAAAKQLEACKTLEATLRRKAADVLGSADKKEGTEKILLDNGWQAVVGKSLNYNVTNKNGEVWQLRERGMPSDVFTELFKITYELSVTAYRKLTEAQQSFLAPCLTITQGMPTLKMEAPKEDKVI